MKAVAAGVNEDGCGRRMFGWLPSQAPCEGLTAGGRWRSGSVECVHTRADQRIQKEGPLRPMWAAGVQVSRGSWDLLLISLPSW